MRWRLFHFPDDASVRFMQKLGVDTIVVHPEAEARLRAPDSRWRREGPFPEGHLLLRLKETHPDGFAPSKATDKALQELPRAGWRARSNLPNARRAIDGDLATFWSTHGPAREHQFIAVSFDSVVRPARISMMLGNRRHFPMRFEVLGLREDRTWMRLSFDQDRVYDDLLHQLLHRPLETSVDVDLKAPWLREVLVRTTKTDAYELPWSIAEIRVFTERDAVGRKDAYERPPLVTGRATRR